jgi:hypothetical protein
LIAQPDHGPLDAQASFLPQNPRRAGRRTADVARFARGQLGEGIALADDVDPSGRDAGQDAPADGTGFQRLQEDGELAFVVVGGNDALEGDLPLELIEVVGRQDDRLAQAQHGESPLGCPRGILNFDDAALPEELRCVGAELLVLAQGAGGVEERIVRFGGDLQPLARLDLFEGVAGHQTPIPKSEKSPSW